MSIIPLTVPPKKLAQTISASAMTFKMNNIQGWNGVALTPADFGTEAYGVFINSTRTQIEIFAFDPATIADASITILRRGLGYSGQDVEDAGRKYPWASNDTTVQLGTDAPQLFRDFLSESNPATIAALHTYDVLPQSVEVPVNDEDFVNKAYVDGLTQPSITVPVLQVSHSLVVGDVIRVSGANIYTKAQANSPTGSEVVGVVSEVVDVDNFKYITEGILTAGVPSYPAGTVVFLSRTVAGAFVDTDTSTVGEVSAPLGIVIQNGARMTFHRYRPAVINTISGNPIASETVAGMVEQATPAQVAAKTDVGETGAPLFVVPSLIPAPDVKRNCRVYATVNTPSTNNLVKVAFQSENFDADGFHDNVTNNTRLTIPVGAAGKYIIGASLNTENTNSGVMSILYNNTTIIAWSCLEGYSTTNNGGSISTVYDLAEGDYVELQYQFSHGIVPGQGSTFWLTKID